MDISTKYMGLELKSPIIAGSSSLTEKVENSVAYEKAGAGAIVLKSLFEEQILHDVDAQRLNNMYDTYSDQENYAMYFSKKHNLSNYISLIQQSKATLNIPVIASINCVTAEGWFSYAKMIQEAGADALEINVFLLPADIHEVGEEKEKVYFDIIEKVSDVITIPFSVKLSYYFSGLANFIYRISETNASSVVLFNKFYSPDVDIEKEKVFSGDVFSTKELNTMTMRWIGILHGKTNIELTASGGIFNGEQVIKNLLVGAQVVEVVSAIYKEGPKVIEEMTQTLKDWMTRHKYSSIEDFRGKASQINIKKPVLFDRTQFMRYFSDAGY